MVHIGDHLWFGIICSPIWGSFPVWGSFAVGDHLRRCTVLIKETIVTSSQWVFMTRLLFKQWYACSGGRLLLYRIFNQSEPSSLPEKLYISACYIALIPCFGCTPSQLCSSIGTRNFAILRRVLLFSSFYVFVVRIGWPSNVSTSPQCFYHRNGLRNGSITNRGSFLRYVIIH